MNKTELSAAIQKLMGLAPKVSPGWWTTENDHQGKWNIYDEHGNDLAMAHQVLPLPQDRKQESRTVNAEWIATANPKVVMAMIEEIQSLQSKINSMESEK